MGQTPSAAEKKEMPRPGPSAPRSPAAAVQGPTNSNGPKTASAEDAASAGTKSFVFTAGASAGSAESHPPVTAVTEAVTGVSPAPARPVKEPEKEAPTMDTVGAAPARRPAEEPEKETPRETARTKSKPKTLYVLRLESGKFYVGTSGNPAARFDAHKKGTGAAWTAKYPPIEMIKTEPDKTRQDEDAEVKRLMLEHGIDNVRGGSYVNVSLPAYQKAALAKELQHATDKCFACGASGHYAKECPNVARPPPKPSPSNLRQPVEGGGAGPRPNAFQEAAPALHQMAEKLAQIAECLAPGGVPEGAKASMLSRAAEGLTQTADRLAHGAPKEPRAAEKPEIAEELKAAEEPKAENSSDCTRCGRNGHRRRTCYAKSSASGSALPSEGCIWCGRRGHNFSVCTASTDGNGVPLKFKGCGRCGRKNHQAEKCFAKTDTFGDPLD